MARTTLKNKEEGPACRPPMDVSNGSSSLTGSLQHISKHQHSIDNPPELGSQSYEDQDGRHHPIPEFLYQLTKMLSDDNSHVIEWQEGKIKVHDPNRLEEILQKYFRHSKFASFQRQLNYFGFRKIAGKGKLSPCSYVNEMTTEDIRSLLLIKRKTNGSAARRAAAAAATLQPLSTSSSPVTHTNKLTTNNFLVNSNGTNTNPSAVASYLAVPLSTYAQLNFLALQHQQLQRQVLEAQQSQLLNGTGTSNNNNNNNDSTATMQQQQQQMLEAQQKQFLEAQQKHLMEQAQQKQKQLMLEAQQQQKQAAEQLLEARAEQQQQLEAQYKKQLMEAHQKQMMEAHQKLLLEAHQQLLQGMQQQQQNPQLLAARQQLLQQAAAAQHQQLLEAAQKQLLQQQQNKQQNKQQQVEALSGVGPATAALGLLPTKKLEETSSSCGIDNNSNNSFMVPSSNNNNNNSNATNSNGNTSALSLLPNTPSLAQFQPMLAAANGDNNDILSSLRQRLPSTNTLFPDFNLSSARLNSLLSLNSFLGSSSRLNSEANLQHRNSQ